MMLNISSEAAGIGAGVLIRAAEPLTGIETMRRRRRVENIHQLASGPGRLTQAFGIDLSLDGTLYGEGNPLWLADDGSRAPRIARSMRIGITRNAERPWRYFVRGPWVSGPVRLNNPPARD